MKKKGISLIVLVITIVVVIILAAAVILSLGENNPINDARVANIAQEKDAIDSGIVTYTSRIKVKYEGMYDTDQIILGSTTGVDNLSEYKIVTDDSFDADVDGTTTTLYKLDEEKVASKLNLKISKPTADSAWYVDKYGKAYLVFDEDVELPKWTKANSSDEEKITNPSLKDYTMQKGTDLIPEISPDYFQYGTVNGKYGITGLMKLLPEQVKLPTKDSSGNEIKIIASGVLMRNTTLKKLIVPSGYEAIGDTCCSMSPNLEEVILPNTLTSIGNAAFSSCPKLVSVNIPGTVISLGNAPFGGCSGLTNLTLGYGLTTLGDAGTFAACTA